MPFLEYDTCIMLFLETVFHKYKHAVILVVSQENHEHETYHFYFKFSLSSIGEHCITRSNFEDTYVDPALH